MEERVQEIEEQLCKLDSDKCVVEVRFLGLLCVGVCVCGGVTRQPEEDGSGPCSVSTGPGV